MICALGAITRFVAHRGLRDPWEPAVRIRFYVAAWIKKFAFKAFVAAQRHSQSSNIQNFQIRQENMSLKQLHLSHLFY